MDGSGTQEEETVLKSRYRGRSGNAHGMPRLESAADDTVDEPDAARGVLRKYEIPEGKVDLVELEANDSPLPEDQADP